MIRPRTSFGWTGATLGILLTTTGGGGGAAAEEASTCRKAANLALKSGLGSSSGTTLTGAGGGGGFEATFGSAVLKFANLSRKFGSRSGVTLVGAASGGRSKLDKRLLKDDENSPRLAVDSSALLAFVVVVLLASKAERLFWTTSDCVMPESIMKPDVNNKKISQKPDVYNK